MHPNSEGRVELTAEEPHTPHLVELVRSGRRLVRILTDELHPSVFDDEALSYALSELARDNRHSEVRILVKQSHYMVGRSHHLAILNKRIPSLVSVRKLTYNPESYVGNYMLVDDAGLYYDPRDDEKICFINPDDGPTVKHLGLEFDELWSKSQDDPELRSLGV